MITCVYLLLPQLWLPHRATADRRLGTLAGPEALPARGSATPRQTIVGLATLAIGHALALVRWVSPRPVAAVAVVAGSTSPPPPQTPGTSVRRPTVRRRPALSTAPRVRPRTT